MTLNVASLNVRGLRDPSKRAHLLGEHSNLCVDIAAVQKTQLIRAEDCRVLEGDFVVFLAFGSRCNAEVSLLVGRGLDAIVNLVFAHDRDRLVVADVAVKSFEFRVVEVYAPNCVGDKRSFLRRLEPFFDDSNG